MLITQPKLSEHNAPFVDVTFRRFAAEHCVYEVWHNTALIYIGVCNFVSIGKLFSGDIRGEPRNGSGEGDGTLRRCDASGLIFFEFCKDSNK